MSTSSDATAPALEPAVGPVGPGPGGTETGARRDRICLVLILALIYAPVAFGRYAVSDDYHWLWQVTTAWERWPEFFSKYWSDGRPVQFANLFLLRWAGDLGHMGWARLPSVVGVLCLGWRLHRAAVRWGWSRPAAFAVTLAVTCAPAFQVCVNWVVCTNYLAGCLVAEFVVATTTYALASRGWPRFGFACSAVAMNVFAFCCFQPAGCFLWVWSFLQFVPKRASASALLRPIGALLAVFLSSAAFAYVVIRICPEPNVRAALATDPLHKALWFVRHPLLDAVALSAAMHRWIGLLAFLTLAVAGAWGWMFGQTRRAAGPFLLLLACLPLTYLPNLVIAESWVSYRTSIALGPCVAILAWGFYEESFARRAPPVLAAGLRMILCGVLAATALHQIVRGYVDPQSRELRVLEQALMKTPSSTPRPVIELRLTEPRDLLGSAARYDEFGVPSSVNSWALEPMARLVLAERGLPAPGFRFLTAGQPAPRAGIDMRTLRLAAAP